MPKTKTLPALKGENKLDNDLVIKAKEEIKKILAEHLGAAAYEVVDYLVSTFFDGKKDDLSIVRLRKHKTFQKLLESIQEETGKSQSWVYEAVKLWQDRELLGDFEPYMQLSISHRALLLKVTDIEDKKKYAEEFAVKSISYQKAKEKLKTESPTTDYSILKRLINHPDKEMDDYKKNTHKSSLAKHYDKLNENQKSEIIKKAKERLEKTEQDFNTQKELYEKAKLIQNKLNDLAKVKPDDSEA